METQVLDAMRAALESAYDVTHTEARRAKLPHVYARKDARTFCNRLAFGQMTGQPGARHTKTKGEPVRVRVALPEHAAERFLEALALTGWDEEHKTILADAFQARIGG